MTDGPAIACCVDAVGEVGERRGEGALVRARAVLDDHHRRRRIGTGRQQVAAHQRRVADAHVDRKRGLLRGQRRPVEIGRAVGRGAGDDRELPHPLAQGHGQADARSTSMRRGHARHDLDGDARRLQRRHLFRGAAEDEGIAALEPRHDLAGLRLAHQDAIDLGLRGGRAARRLADEDALGVAARVLQDLRVHQPVHHQHVGLLQPLQRLQGEQVGIAGAAADQRHAALFLADASSLWSSVARMRPASSSAPLSTARRNEP